MPLPLIPLAAIALGSGAAAGIGAGLMSGGGSSEENNSRTYNDDHSVTKSITKTYAPVQAYSPVFSLNLGSGDQSVSSSPYLTSTPSVSTSQQPTSNPNIGNTGSGSGGSGLLSGVSDKTFLILGGLAVLGLLGYGLVSSGGRK